MVYTLHRYIFRELLKVFVLAVVGLTLILSLGSILRPVQEYGVGPRQVLSLMGYFLPITLTFVLPMAALFSSALVYGRFAGDNEIDACRASGISVFTLVYPGLALAIVVAIINLILSFHMMPYFVHLAETALKADAKQILFRNIQRKGYYKLPTDDMWLIYADQAHLESGELVGLVVTNVKPTGADDVYAAERARVQFSPHERTNEVQIYVENLFQVDADDDSGFFVAQGAIRTEFGSLLSDAIKFKKIGEMKRIRADLMRFHPIEKLVGDSYAQFTTELLAQDILTTIGGDPNNYYRLHSGEKLVELTASSVVTGDEKVRLSGEIVVIESEPGGANPPVTMRPAKASLHIEGNKMAPTLTLDMRNVLEENSGDSKMRHVIRGLIRPNSSDVKQRFGTENVLDAVLQGWDSDVLKGKIGPKLKNLRYQLRKKIQITLVKIQAEMHSRLVFGIGCVPMILIGIGLGIIKKGGHLLTAFGASCLPAAVLIVCIISGKQIMKNLGSTDFLGMALIWGGLGFLLLLSAVIYHRLLKN